MPLPKPCQGVFADLSSVMQQFRMRLPPEFSLVVRALGSLEGTASALDPTFQVGAAVARADSFEISLATLYLPLLAPGQTSVAVVVGFNFGYAPAHTQPSLSSSPYPSLPSRCLPARTPSSSPACSTTHRQTPGACCCDCCCSPTGP